jgi:hypothetical protein
MGIAVERPEGPEGQESQGRHGGLEVKFTSAFVSDPWGTLIELTEGLGRIS